MERRHTDVRSGAAVFEVSVALRADMTRNTDGSATVSNARREGANVTGLVTPRETEVVVLAVDRNMLIVPLRKFRNRLLDELHASRLAHRLRRVVGVAAGTVPIAREGLGVEGNLDTPLLRNADEEVTSHPEVVTH